MIRLNFLGKSCLLIQINSRRCVLLDKIWNYCRQTSYFTFFTLNLEPHLKFKSMKFADHIQIASIDISLFPDLLILITKFKGKELNTLEDIRSTTITIDVPVFGGR